MNEEIMVLSTAFGAPKLVPLTITFVGFGELNPADDITAKEAAQIAMMLCASTIRGSFADYEAFIKENKLERHFKP